MRKILIFAFIAAVTFAAGTAAAGNGGSSYSLLGIGDIRLSPGARSMGMGSAGYAVMSMGSINLLSPASWSRLDRTTLEAGALYEGFNSDNGKVKRFLATTRFDGVALALPLDREKGLVLVGSFTPYSNVDYNTYTAGSYISSTDTLNYTVQHTGNGGVTKAQFGLSYDVNQSLSVGASFNYLFGTIDNTTSMVASAGTFGNGDVVQNVVFSGSTVTLGAIFRNFGGITEALRPLSIGAVVTTRSSVNATRHNTYGFGTTLPSFASELDTSADENSSLVVPFAWGVGLAYNAGERYIIAADYAAQPWRQSEYFGATPANIRNSHRISVGLERAAGRDYSLSWLQRLAFRLGFQYNATYFKAGTEPINEILATAGIGIPLAGTNRLDVAIEYGQRGTNNNALIKDNILRLSVALHISELWFERPEEEY